MIGSVGQAFIMLRRSITLGKERALDSAEALYYLLRRDASAVGEYSEIERGC